MFTLRELEKNPNALVAPTGKFVMPPPGTVAWDDEKVSGENYKDIIERLSKVVSQRRLDCWPPFQDYDKFTFFNHFLLISAYFLRILLILD